LTADFSVEAVEEAIVRYGRPQISNTGRGTQFTSDAFAIMLHGHGVAISMSQLTKPLLRHFMYGSAGGSRFSQDDSQDTS
jgi:hypothetical protein